MQEGRYRIGGCVFNLNFDGFRILDWPHPFYTPFYSRLTPQIHLNIRRVKSLPDSESVSKLKFSALYGGVHDWKIFSHKQGFQIDLFNSATDRCDKRAFVASDFSRGELFVRKDEWHMDRLLRPFLDLVLVNYLALQEGVMMHASSVRVENQGFLFTGYSGAGKTTMARFWNSRTGNIQVLNDERSVIKHQNNEWKLFGTPWPGDGYMVGGGEAPLTAVFIVRHGKTNTMKSLSPLEALQNLMAQIYAPYWKREQLENVVSSLEGIVKNVPCYQLDFVKDIKVTHFIEKYLAGHGRHQRTGV